MTSKGVPAAMAASLALISFVALPLTAEAAEVVSTFDTAIEGWSIATIGSGDWIVFETYPVNYGASGGNPGGHIHKQDPDNRSFFFDAPSEFRGDLTWAYGGTLSFDRFVVDGPEAVSTDLTDVLLYGAGLTIGYDVTIPDSTWTSDTVPLQEGEWMFLNMTTATQSEFQAVLADVNMVAIRGEHFDGPDTGGLDNVRLMSIPSTAVALELDPSVEALGATVFPNPFRPHATIAFELSSHSPVDVTVFDVGGRRVVTLADGWKTAGRHEVRWSGLGREGRRVVAGQYFVRVRSGHISKTLGVQMLR